MKATLVVIAIGMLAPSSASAWGWGNSGSSSTSSTNPTGTDYNAASKKPYWQQRYENRLKQQWLKPGGENFPNPAKPSAADLDPNKQDLAGPDAQQNQNEQFIEQLKKQQEREKLAREARQREQKRSLFQRFLTAWKSLWKNRTLGAGAQSPFANTGGFGENVHRAVPTVGMEWRTRNDLHSRIRFRSQRSWGQGRQGFLAPMY